MKELTQHLNWEVQIEELLLPGNRKTDRFALTRSDNGELLSVRSDRYHPIFNKDLELICERLIKWSGFRFMGYKEFQNGKRILAFFVPGFYQETIYWIIYYWFVTDIS